jgi:hypothetical protein
MVALKISNLDYAEYFMVKLKEPLNKGRLQKRENF